MSEPVDEPVSLIVDYECYPDYNSLIDTGPLSSANEAGDGLTLYPSWCPENGAPLTLEAIFGICHFLQRVFGFQKDNTANIHEFLMCMLDSRSSRTTCMQALVSVHADYIAGENANYKKWYFAAHFELDEGAPMKRSAVNRRWRQLSNLKKMKRRNIPPYTLGDLDDEFSLLGLEYKWRREMSQCTPEDCITQVALYLLIWGEANNVRFMPECLCFIYKCSFDYLCWVKQLESIPNEQEFAFLESVIDPLYHFIRDQQYELVEGRWKKRLKRDHGDIIGYDDVNQFFWYPDSLSRIELYDGTKLLGLARSQRYLRLKFVNWNKLLYKTYKETRSWLHIISNFSRIWVIHCAMFWYYTSFNSPTLYTVNYIQLLDNQPELQVQWSVVALGGALACIISVFGVLIESLFVPRMWPGANGYLCRAFLLVILFAINAAPTIYIFGFVPRGTYNRSAHIVSIVQFVVSCVTYLYLAIVPPSELFGFLLQKNSNVIKSKLFTMEIATMSTRSNISSYVLWFFVFLFKFIESYFFLTLSVRDPVRILSTMKMRRCTGDVIFGDHFCVYQPQFTLAILYLADLVLFFLDTYLWYIICNCIFSVVLSLFSGISVFSPWRNLFARLPERIHSKIIHTRDSKQSPKMLVAQVWNCIVFSMYREHFLSIEQVNKLAYLLSGEYRNDDNIMTPLFFIFQDDNKLNMDDFFPPCNEAERRITFFAHSLSVLMPEPIPILSMPSFTVLIPHYSEKIILTLKEIMKEDQSSKLSILEYLKSLQPSDWNSFVRDTKVFSLEHNGVAGIDDENQSAQLKTNMDIAFEELAVTLESNISTFTTEENGRFIQNQFDDIPYYCVGFKSSDPEYVMRTRLWASLRSQTLYRTISGFSNYESAIKLLYELENDIEKKKQDEQASVKLDNFVRRKFRLLVSMQRFQKFSQQEKADATFLFESHPRVEVAYLEEEFTEKQETRYYATLLDLSQQDQDGNYRKKFRIRLSGNPILGDGKSDNQNISIAFYRGEYIQVIDANQDNYIEECLKIKSILAEFEEIDLNRNEDYIPGVLSPKSNSPVAIIGAREYIFSENFGVLGDIAAGKERTFGTLFARTLSEIGGKLHYGHPDFINGIFMTTRGGISKAQKGLHLNEDIYAGMNALCRGGRIKHCDYYQCGKGRDQGFGTILNFTNKIGAGMGEQILSREHYYLGTLLPIDRFLSFYYAHAGFHLNNLFIILSVQIFMIVLVNLGSLRNESIICNYNSRLPITDLEQPLGCYNLQPVLNWVALFVMSVIICFFISFIPLVVQEIIEKGTMKAFGRIISHFISLSPLFEVFVCQIYAIALMNNMLFGGARYIATGRGLAVSRIPFTQLYSRYSLSSISYGVNFGLAILFASITMWQFSLLWFWIIFLALTMAPFMFNPHQFSRGEFFLDYREFLRWLSRGNVKSHDNSWVGFRKSLRSQMTGNKQKPSLKRDSTHSGEGRPRPSTRSKLFNQIPSSLLVAMGYCVPYLFITSQNGVKNPIKVNPLARIAILTLLPIAANMVVLLLLFAFSVIAGPLLTLCCFKRLPSVIAGIAHACAVVNMILFIVVSLYVHQWNFARALCGFILVFSFLKFLLLIVFSLFLSEELTDDRPNAIWWSGKWYTLGWRGFIQPIREFMVKTIEMGMFAYDFAVGHLLFFLMCPILMIPYVDKLHTLMLFWLRPTGPFRKRIMSRHQKNKRRLTIVKYFIVFLLVLSLFAAVIVVPLLFGEMVPNISEILLDSTGTLIQPNHQDFNDTGVNAPSFVLKEKPDVQVFSDLTQIT